MVGKRYENCPKMWSYTHIKQKICVSETKIKFCDMHLKNEIYHAGLDEMDISP